LAARSTELKGTPLLLWAVLTVEDNAFYRPPSTTQNQGSGAVTLTFSIFAPVKSELESRPSPSQMPSASGRKGTRPGLS